MEFVQRKFIMFPHFIIKHVLLYNQTNYPFETTDSENPYRDY